MITLLFLAAVSFLLYRLLGGAPQLRLRPSPADSAQAKIDELTTFASRLRATNKFNGAEKVYLQILKINHKHAPTYNKLGTLYMIMKNHTDAIECFQLAAQLSPSATTFYNLGLALYENQNPVKAVAALEKSVMFEPSAARCVGLAKAYSRTGQEEKMVAALEQAAELDDSPKILKLLIEGYEATGRTEQLEAAKQRLKATAAPRRGLRAGGQKARAATQTLSRTRSRRA